MTYVLSARLACMNGRLWKPRWRNIVAIVRATETEGSGVCVHDKKVLVNVSVGGSLEDDSGVHSACALVG